MGMVGDWGRGMVGCYAYGELVLREAAESTACVGMTGG